MEEELDKLECPFTWDMPENILDLEELSDTKEQRFFLINGFCVKIVDVYETFRSGQIENAKKKIKELEMEVAEYTPIGLFKDVDSQLWDVAQDAMQHILYATMAHLAFQDNDLQAVDEAMLKVNQLDITSDSKKAAVLGAKCHVLIMYGPYESSLRAIKEARKAIKLDRSIPLWHFYLGKALARHRRAMFYYDPVTDEEIEALERAYTETRKPDAGVMLLHTYSEIGRKPNNGRFTDYEERIRDLLRVIPESAGDEWYIRWRCAHLAMRLPANFLTNDEIKRLVAEAVECALSCNLNEYQMMFLNALQCCFYRKYENDLDKALEFGMKAAEYGEYPSVMEVLSILHIQRKDELLLDSFNRFLNNEKLKEKKNDLLILKANYLMFVKNDIHEAMKIYIPIMKSDPKTYPLLHVRALFKEQSWKSTIYRNLITKLEKVMRYNAATGNSQYRSYLEQIKELEKKSV